MSKKHFVDLANIIRDVAQYAALNETQHRLVAQAIADVCEKHNPRFDYHCFLAVCGVSKTSTAKETEDS